MSEPPNPVNFEAASATVREDADSGLEQQRRVSVRGRCSAP
jgi:hypothetical protein